MTPTHASTAPSTVSRQGILRGMHQLPATAAQLGSAGLPVHAVVCLQDAETVARDADLLEELARHATVTVVSTGRPRLPGHLAHVELDAGDALEDELSVVLCSRDGGAALVGHELPGDARFAWEAVHGRRGALAHARRVLRELGARLEPGCSAALQAAVAAMARHDDDVELPGHAELCAAVADDGARRLAAV